MNRKLILPGLALLVMLACTLPAVAGTPTLDVSVISATQTAAALLTAVPPGEGDATAVVPETAAPTPGLPSQGGIQFIAYIRDGQLLVTDVSANVQGGTTQYTLAGESDQVSDLVWSPSGNTWRLSHQPNPSRTFFIFSRWVRARLWTWVRAPHLPGRRTASRLPISAHSLMRISGSQPSKPGPRQLTFETNYAWGRPVFTPDGESLIVAGTSRDNMGASGNTNFTWNTWTGRQRHTKSPARWSRSRAGACPMTCASHRMAHGWRSPHPSI
jgi:Flp pilus assembly protein TadG